MVASHVVEGLADDASKGDDHELATAGQKALDLAVEQRLCGFVLEIRIIGHTEDHILRDIDVARIPGHSAEILDLRNIIALPQVNGNILGRGISMIGIRSFSAVQRERIVLPDPGIRIRVAVCDKGCLIWLLPVRHILSPAAGDAFSQSHIAQLLRRLSR